ncbi:MAG TPA: bifunctional metallophosphatase/5'-nucleotidase, partial [Actinoplanes sp.]|nr:bifunctional metallophosphatase/5'-nucleotidase [Actinoplanes sp.]
MIQSRRRGWAVLRNLAVPAFAVAVVAALPMTRPDAPADKAAEYGPGLTPVSVSYGQPEGETAAGQFLSYNDFHGAIDPPAGSGGLINGNPAGGVEYLATWLERLRAEGKAEDRPTLTVGAGDLIGATPLVSAAFHDEPTIELMNEVGLQVSSVGNHEFDEGVAELLRMQGGGCHPTDGCQDGDGFAGADFKYLAANTVSKKTGKPILPAISIRRINGVAVGFVGLTLKGTPSIVNPAGIRDVDFLDEVETANKWGAVLKERGVQAQVLLIHEGGAQGVNPAPLSGCDNFAGAIAPIVAGLNPEFGLVVS